VITDIVKTNPTEMKNLDHQHPKNNMDSPTNDLTPAITYPLMMLHMNGAAKYNKHIGEMKMTMSEWRGDKGLSNSDYDTRRTCFLRAFARFELIGLRVLRIVILSNKMQENPENQPRVVHCTLQQNLPARAVQSRLL